MSVPPVREAADDRLDSWKEIAAYLGREVRTVQGWEKSEGLPVHRHQHARQGSVYAFRQELDAWREARRGAPEPPPVQDSPAPATPAGRRNTLLLFVVGLLTVSFVGAFALWKSRHVTAATAMDRETHAVVVLPFLDLSPHKDQEYFSDGLTEEIIDALSRVPNLHVVARTSAFAFKGKNIDVRQIGEQLNVNTVLEGSVRKSGDELRITAQLNRAADGYHLWSRTYDRPLRDIFAVQREISQSIADQLRVGEVPRRETTPDLEAYRLYQEGRYFFNQFQPPESNQKAIDRYRQAIQRDPRFALAYAGMADAYAYLAENAVTWPKQVMPKAKEAAEKAVALDDNSSEAHTSLGMVKLDYERDREGAQREFRRAIQLNPGLGWAHHWLAHSLEAQGRLDDAMKEMHAALDLDPLSIPINWDITSELLCARRYDAALSHTNKAGELFPNVPLFSYLKIEAYRGKGDLASAHRIEQALKTSQPALAKDPMFMAQLGVQAALEGRRAEAVNALAQLERLREVQYVEPFFVLELCSALKDNKQLLLWLRRADEERSTLFVYLPAFKDLFRLDPQLLAQVDNYR